MDLFPQYGSSSWKVIGRSNKAESPLPQLDEQSDCTGYSSTKMGWYDKTKIPNSARDSLVVSGNRFHPEREHDVIYGDILVKFCTTAPGNRRE